MVWVWVWVHTYIHILVDEVTMNMAEYTSSWYSAAGAAEECQYLWDGGGGGRHFMANVIKNFHVFLQT